MRLKVSVNARQGQMDIETIRDLIVPIAGYDEQKRRMLCGELERLRWSLEWIARQSGGSLLDLGSSGMNMFAASTWLVSPADDD